jgi:hypothetical protein
VFYLPNERRGSSSGRRRDLGPERRTVAGMGVAWNTVSRKVRGRRVDVIRLGGHCATRI